MAFDDDEERIRSLAEMITTEFGFHFEETQAPWPVNDFVSDSSPGISPTALLDSSLLLPNYQLSPTTGTYPVCADPLVSLYIGDLCNDEDFESSFGFDSGGFMNSPPSYFELENQDPSLYEPDQSNGPDHHQTLDWVEPKTDPEFPKELSAVTPANYATDPVSQLCYANGNSSSDTANVSLQIEHPIADEAAMNHNRRCNRKSVDHSVGADRVEDGYNWRKYGQKQVKGSEFPRSYYKCTHGNCPGRKKVERSHDGHITEIIYTEEHNHEKPHPHHQTPCCVDESEERKGIVTADQIQSRNAQSGFKDLEGLEPSSSVALSGFKRKSRDFDTVETLQLPSDAREGGTVDGCGDEKDLETKRRCVENSFTENNMIPSSRSGREPKILLQLCSEIDILDDGYRWRKYGQKVVKGNPNPRSYYKCTSDGCQVRKHVERASDDLKSIIVSYEGVHCHQVPSLKNNSHGTRPSNPNSTRQSLWPFPRNPNALKPNMGPHFNTGFYHDAPSFPSLPPLYGMNLPPVPDSLLYGSFAMNSNRPAAAAAAHQVGPMPSILPGFHIPSPMCPSAPPELPLGRFGLNQYVNPMVPVQSLDAGQVPNDNDIIFSRPKLERQEDVPSGVGFATGAHDNASSSRSVYHYGYRGFPM